jgi:hypothetical protein
MITLNDFSVLFILEVILNSIIHQELSIFSGRKMLSVLIFETMSRKLMFI